MRKLQANYATPGILVNKFNGLPVDVLNTAISYLRREFTHDLLGQLVDGIGDDDELVVRLVVEVISNDDLHS